MGGRHHHHLAGTATVVVLAAGPYLTSGSMEEKPSSAAKHNVGECVCCQARGISLRVRSGCRPNREKRAMIT